MEMDESEWICILNYNFQLEIKCDWKSVPAKNKVSNTEVKEYFSMTATTDSEIEGIFERPHQFESNMFVFNITALNNLLKNGKKKLLRGVFLTP